MSYHEIEVRIGRQQILEVVFNGRESVEVLPYPLLLNQLAEKRQVTRLGLGYALSDYMVAIVSDNVCYWRKKTVPFIQMMDVEADEDGNEVEVWVEADYQVANKLQFHHTNHRDPDAPDCECGVVAMKHDDDGIPVLWGVTL